MIGAAQRVRANLTGLARGLFALYLPMLVVWGSQPDARGQLVAALGIVIASMVGVMALGPSRTLLFLAIVLPVTLSIENIGVAASGPIPIFASSCARHFANVGIKGPLAIILF
jgi:hypothetical protein